MDDGIIRRKGGFTVVNNTIARDSRLSLKSKGLYLLIQSHITMPDKQWTKKDFFERSIEGEKAFESGWKELKEKGYLKRHVYHKTNGQFINEYVLLDEPEDGPHTFNYDAEGNVTSTNLSEEINTKNTEIEPPPQNGVCGNGGDNNKDYRVNNTTREKYNKSNNSVNINPIATHEVSVECSLEAGALSSDIKNKKAPGG